jgi:hypothetical protein
MVPKTAVEFKLEGVRERLTELEQWLVKAAQEGVGEHEVEGHLFREMLALGAQLLGAFLKLVGPGDLGKEVAWQDGRTVKRWPEQHARRLLTVFGEFWIARWVYGTRPGQKLELAPTDQRLQLPEGDLSYLLQEWDQLLGMAQAFGLVRETLEAILGFRQSVDTLERGNRQMAKAAPAFRQSQPAPEPGAEGALLVVTEDNKGVPMVRPVEAAAAGCHRKKGEKANKKQMACIGCVYTVDPHVRTPEELVATLFRDPDRPRQKAPGARQKRYWTALTRDEDGRTVRAQDEVFPQLRDDVALRRRPSQTVVHLSDGQHSLETDRRKYLPQDRHTVDALDLMHVLPRLGEAAHLFHPEGSNAAAQFVRERLQRVLEGAAGRVIGRLRQMGTKQGLRGVARKRLRRLCAFLENNLHRMCYDEYLRAGYPIATGVIEGACRHVIKDRMERAGMRWKVPGAQAMLQLRTLHANGDWRAFQDHRIKHETARLYPHARILQNTTWNLAL